MLYPLFCKFVKRKMNNNINHMRDQITLARTEIKNLRQQLTALKHEHLKEIKFIKALFNDLRCTNCGDAATTLCGNDITRQGSTSIQDNLISYRPIGVIETSFQNKRGVPRQPSVVSKAKGTVVIDMGVYNNPEHALSGLEEFSHMWIIFHFHATESTNVPAKVAPPRLGGERRGVFSTRSPHRPCPIGLSLVQIESIEGNKIHFLGVDMVNGTPIMDIKPYIPQYDYPMSFSENSLPLLIRPPTEGISDATEAIANVRLDDHVASSSPYTIPIGIDTDSPPSNSQFEDDLPSPTIRHSNFMTPVSPSPDESPPNTDLVDGNFNAQSPIRRSDIERGSPDGQERFTPPQTTHLVNMRNDGIRVASWISNPPLQTYEVTFTEDALHRLQELIGDRAETFKCNIESLLSEDPRSNYVRTRYPNHEYSCVLEDLSISCVFDENSQICTIIAVRNSEDLQQT